MKQKNIQQEVLVPTQTSFARQSRIGHGGGDVNALADELEKGFWSGLLTQMLPELVIPLYGAWSEDFIWQISFGEFLLLIDMAESPEMIDDRYSINPCCFLSIPKLN